MKTWRLEKNKEQTRKERRNLAGKDQTIYPSIYKTGMRERTSNKEEEREKESERREGNNGEEEETRRHKRNTGMSQQGNEKYRGGERKKDEMRRVQERGGN